MESLPGEADVYLWRGERRAVLLEPDELDQAFEAAGLLVDAPTETVRVPMGEGFRVTINARYGKVPAEA